MIDTTQRSIAFSPPDITQAEVDRVAEAMRSGWITTGPAVKELESKLADFTGAAGVACLSSATASLEGILRLLGIGQGDEVIVPAYTYTATASPVCHVGATLVMCDIHPDRPALDLDALEGLVTERTKAVIGVDVAGIVEDYAGIAAVLARKASLYRPATDMQRLFDHAVVIADAAHSLGATQDGIASGAIADFTSFSFHAVKNFTTAEGGALAWRQGILDDEDIYRRIMLYSLHGQTKDALTKTQKGSWEYDIAYPGYKCNMTDIQAAMGLAQLERYPGLLARRREMVQRYERNLADSPANVLEHYPVDAATASSGHLMITRIEGAGASERNHIIELLAERGVSANVHYKPLPMLSAYRNLGFDSADFPHAHAFFENEVTLPLHTLLTDDDIDYVCHAYLEAIGKCL